MRELQVLIDYNNYGARSDGIFVRFFSDINFFSSLFDDAVAFFLDTFLCSLICDGVVVIFLVVYVILQWRV